MRYGSPVTKNRFVGQLSRQTALRKRQQGFLRVLADCGGSRIQAVEASGIPLGTVQRWQSDPWFRIQYDEIRNTLAHGQQALRESLEAASNAIIFGKPRGVLTGAAIQRIVERLDEAPRPARRAKRDRQPGALQSLEELDAEIRRLLRG